MSFCVKTHRRSTQTWVLAQTLSIRRLGLKRDGTRVETRFRFSPKRMSPFKSAGVSVQSIAGSRGVRISGISAGYTKFRGNVKSTGYLLHSPVSSSLPLPCVTVCHQVSNALCMSKYIINNLTPNGHYMGRTAQLTSRCCILYIYSTNIRTEYFKHAT